MQSAQYLQTEIVAQENDPQSAPFLPLRHFRTIQEGFDTLFKGEKDSEEPFIVDQAQEFSQVNIPLLRALFVQEKDVMCWFETKTEIFNDAYIDGAALFDAWTKEELKFNVVDAPNKHMHLLPPILAENAKNMSEVGQEYTICYALTKSNNLTRYHTDKYAQGWVYLTCGSKIWHIFAAKDVKYLEEHGYTLDDIKEMDFNQLIRILDNYLWGKIYVGEMRGGDFIYFPHLWAHRVFTYEKSFGVCGYNSTAKLIN